MWRNTARDWPALNEQVIGIVRGGNVSWWTRTDDGWYVSDVQGKVGHRDAMRATESKGPCVWTHAPKLGEFPGET